jgi:hypothetical protein
MTSIVFQSAKADIVLVAAISIARIFICAGSLLIPTGLNQF